MNSDKKRDATITQGMAEYIVGTGYGDIPPSIIKKAKDCLLDIIGVSFYGSKFEASRIALSIIEGSGNAEGGTSVFGHGRKILPSLAAFTNGVMAHVADFDDILPIFGHPSCVLMPAALAACETAGGSGKDFLAAFVIGSELGGKLSQAMGAEFTEVGWHGTAVIGALASASAACKAFHLDREKTANAMGIAASSASGLRVNFGTMTKSYHAGHAAMVGVLSAQLAERGFDSSPVAMEGEEGFNKLFRCKADLSSMVKGLGTDYALNGIIMKPYPSCGGTTSAVDGMIKLREQLNSRFEEIAGIEVRVHPKFLNILFHHNPQTPLEAKFSMEFCASAALLFGQLATEHFEKEYISDPNVRTLMGKVRMIPDDGMRKISQERGILAPVRIKVDLRGGEEILETVWEAKGSPKNPMSRHEIQEKFRNCATQALPGAMVEQIIEKIDGLENLKNISELTSAFIP